MAINPLNMFTRLLLMERRGLERSEALRYSLVLSVNDTARPISPTDLVLTDVIAQRQAEEAAPTQPPPVDRQRDGNPPQQQGPINVAFDIEVVEIQPESGKLVIAFTDTTEGNVEKRVWDFGDGTESDQKKVFHEYGEVPDDGRIVVKLVVTINGVEGSATALIFLIPVLVPEKGVVEG